jgi:hypothetical protein
MTDKKNPAEAGFLSGKERLIVFVAAETGVQQFSQAG